MQSRGKIEQMKNDKISFLISLSVQRNESGGRYESDPNNNQNFF